MSSLSEVRDWFYAAAFVGMFLASFALRRATVLAMWGIVAIFVSLPLAYFFAFLGTYSAPKENIEAWLFSFRFLGFSLLLWSIGDAIGQKIDALTQALKPKADE